MCCTKWNTRCIHFFCIFFPLLHVITCHRATQAQISEGARQLEDASPHKNGTSAGTINIELPACEEGIGDRTNSTAKIRYQQQYTAFSLPIITCNNVTPSDTGANFRGSAPARGRVATQNGTSAGTKNIEIPACEEGRGVPQDSSTAKSRYQQQQYNSTQLKCFSEQECSTIPPVG